MCQSCSVCEEYIADWFCRNCEESLCQECDEVIHAIPDKARHLRTPLKPACAKPTAGFEQHLDATLQKMVNLNVPTGAALSSASTARTEGSQPDYSGLQDDFGY
eukprot:CAMPEP_0172192634 /NCGR_PEP_ID=MMETSP1050-20130122/24446_1 /TAXON_ID=233186 /ORGANISM="Cryptomonas curvata, Strain CCAP979/52" /LENGTH=103 /DNA_ID=CAMNT_0012867977 /DNA_START=134 /DNA_END=442 /DNA_ORIENTATION=-